MLQLSERMLPRYLKSGTTVRGVLLMVKAGDGGRLEGGEFHWESTSVFTVFTVRPSLP